MKVALTGGTIYAAAGDAPLHGGAVILRGDTIASVGDAAVPSQGECKTYDCTGLTLVPGFWNSHVHFFERKWANAADIPAAELERQLSEMLLRYGFTNVFDLSSSWTNTQQIRRRIALRDVVGPFVRSTGEGLIAAGMAPPQRVNDFMGLMKTSLREIESPKQARTAVRRLLAGGADAIKLFLTGAPSAASLSNEAIEAAVTIAREAGKPVFAHPTSGTDVLSAVRAGVDVVAHTTPQSAWGDEIFDLVRANRTAITPTLALWKYVLRHDRAGAQDAQIEAAATQLRAWIDAGGVVLFGPDTAAVEYDPREEYALMAQAGMSPHQILASLTTEPAQRFGAAAYSGRIATGFQADIVALDRSFESDATAFAGVRFVLRAGEFIYRNA